MTNNTSSVRPFSGRLTVLKLFNSRLQGRKASLGKSCLESYEGASAPVKPNACVVLAYALLFLAERETAVCDAAGRQSSSDKGGHSHTVVNSARVQCTENNRKRTLSNPINRKVPGVLRFKQK